MALEAIKADTHGAIEWVYPKDEADNVIDELEEELNRAKSREDVLVTDNRNLLEKVQVLENLVRENSEHYKRNEAQILEASDKLKAEIERLSNALDKEHDETIKYMDELCNAKNEIERLTIDNRGIELRADIADATIEKLKAEIKRLKEYASEQTEKLNVEKENVIQLERCWKETKRALRLSRVERAKAKAARWYYSTVRYDVKFASARVDLNGVLNRVKITSSSLGR